MLLIKKLQAEVWHVQEEERERAAAAPIDLAADRQAALEVSGDEAYARRARSDLTSSRTLRTGTCYWCMSWLQEATDRWLSPIKT